MSVLEATIENNDISPILNIEDLEKGEKTDVAKSKMKRTHPLMHMVNENKVVSKLCLSC